ncbi:hypothetical protein [Streptomyces capitiformicae]|uniref:Uncharacterized protein n=1 Tax=Streptomyces capitiformicae TaxID=2014920 RepID=A0A918Z107_9ACTN|nr:hypothetical protein [Streptomyces capitiformicae]GHE32889.1 hypothetical protein GCM10017771_49770 [Streptomyces capitiformicae]
MPENIVTGFLATVSLVVVVFAVIAIRTAWLLPWLRRSTLRPRMWGYATLVGGVALALFSYAFATERSSAIGAAAVVLFLVSSVLSFLATRPGRVTP